MKQKLLLLILFVVVLGLFVQFGQCDIRKKVDSVEKPKAASQSLYTFQIPQHGCTDEYVRELLRLLNHFRAQHSAPPLALSTKANIYAQSVANLAEQPVQPPNQYNYGFSIFGKVFKGQADKIVQLFPSSIIADLWKYSDAYGPYYGGEPADLNSVDTLKLAQAIWKGSSKVGFGCAVRPFEGKIYAYVVMTYEPHGIVAGHFGENVLPPVELDQLSDKEYEVASQSTGCSVDFQLRLLHLINQFRAQHGTPPLALSNPISDSVQAWIYYSIYGGDAQPDESAQPFKGQLDYKAAVKHTREWVNVFPDVVFDYWANEHADYSRYYGTELEDDKVGEQADFTRLLWRDSKEIGFGCVTYVSNDDSIRVVVSASIDPEGNVDGGYAKNVLPPV